MKIQHYLIIAAMSGLIFCNDLFAQAELNGWAALRGIRVDGELMRFTTGLRAARPDGTEIAQTGNELVRNPRYKHTANKQTCSGSLVFFKDDQLLPFTQTIEDAAPGVAKVDLQFAPTADIDLGSIYFVMNLADADYPDAATEMLDEQGATAKGVRIKSSHRQLEIVFPQPIQIIVKKQAAAGTEIIFALSSGNLQSGQQVQANFTITASGDVDKNPIKLTIDTSQPGRAFDGIGGNFRLQNPNDAPVIQYNLDNLRVAWGRVALPLAQWQPIEELDPHPPEPSRAVKSAMEIARALSQRKIPLIISLWFAPQWALLPNPPGTDQNGQPGRLRGHRLDPAKLDTTCESIGAYLIYLKKNYGVEPELFSFNESDLGIDVRQTPEDHAEMIKRLGAYLESQGLKTKMLLGDTSDAHPVDFINPAANDPEAMKYVAAVSFHSWRGGTDAQLNTWSQAATRSKIPLLVAEGGTDADAHRYPAMFQEPWFALDEIDLYVRICRLCQPKSIMEWQLTSDYSVLSGGRDNQPLVPTMRFWQLKQLGIAPPGAMALPITCDRPAISYCAFAAPDRSGCIVHLVNTGATRTATIAGLPADLKELRVYVTDAKRGMQETSKISVVDGAAQVTLDSLSFTTLIP